MTGSQKKRRGRSSAAHTQDQIDGARVDIEVTRDADAHTPNRPPRVSMGATLKLSEDGTEDPDYHYRWIQDRDGRVEQAMQAWYEFVMAGGQKVSRPSGPYTLYKMRILKKYWNDDQELKLKRTKAKLSQEQKLESDEYLPDGHHHALQKDDYDPLG